MLKKIYKVAFLSIFIISILFLGSTSTDALVKGWEPSADEASTDGDNGDNPLGIVISPSKDNENINDGESVDEMNSDDYSDFGSDQVFPFIPGLDSY